jgi:hypothetical protein
MSYFSPLPLGMLQASKSLLLRLQPKEQDHGLFPLGVILGLVMIYAAHYFSSPYRKLPPGPRGYPIIGNLLDLRSGQWLKFAEWRNKYGQSVPSPFSAHSKAHPTSDQAISSTLTQPVNRSSSSTLTKSPQTYSIDAQRYIQIGRVTLSHATS